MHSLKVLAGVATLAVASMTVSSTRAAALYSESFDYTVGSDVNGNGGWITQGAGDWGAAANSVSATDLVFPGVTSAGGSARLNTINLVRNIAGLSSLGNFYVSALFNKADGSSRLYVGLRQGWNQPEIAGMALNGNGVVQAGNGAFWPGSYVSSAGSTVPAGTTAMLLAYMDVAANTISVWNVTDASAVPTLPDVTYVYSNTNAPGAVTIGYTGNNANTSNLIDEIRIGADPFDVGVTFASVPEPASLALIALGGLALIRRRR